MGNNQVNITGISIIDNVLTIVLAALLAYLFIIGIGRFVKQFQQHQYAQLIAGGLIFLLLITLIRYPDVYMNMAGKAKDVIEIISK